LQAKRADSDQTLLPVSSIGNVHENPDVTGIRAIDALDTVGVGNTVATLSAHRRNALEMLGKADKPMLTGCRIRVHLNPTEVGKQTMVVDGIYSGFAKHKLQSFGLGANWHTIDLGPSHGGEQSVQLVNLPHWSLLDDGEPVENPLGLPKYQSLVKVTFSEGARLLRKFVHHCYGKQVMRQHDSGFGKEEATFQAEGHGANRQVLIDLYKCRIDDLGCSQLASMISLCCRVVSIRLDYNNISDQGATALATAVPCCPLLEQMHLSLNAIGDSGASALAQALDELPALHTLNLRSNDIGSVGVEAFARHLACGQDADVDKTSDDKRSRPLTRLRYEWASLPSTFPLTFF
jgi:hypothetical protein